MQRRSVFAAAGLLMAASLSTAPVHARQFGSAGMDGRKGYTGNSGRDGQSLVIRAAGSPANFEASGTDGTNGGNGENGFRANNCVQPTQNYDVFGAAGGDGGEGGNGGRGGNGGSITVYYTDIAHLAQIYVRATPGYGGNGAWGGRGADGCRCTQPSWTVDNNGTPVTYRYTDGRPGMDAYNGSRGAGGSYGKVTLVGQMEPVAAERPSVHIDMTQITNGPFVLSKNHWEAKRGAKQLFASGSDLADNYALFKGRTEIEYAFEWQASRELPSVRGYHLTLQIEDNDAKLYLPNGLWVDGEKIIDGNKRTWIFHEVVRSNEVGNLQFRSLGGIGDDHVIDIRDGAGVSGMIDTAVSLTYYTAESGRYQQRWQGSVPAEALTISTDGFQVAMSALGIDPAYLANGTKSYVDLRITRSLGRNSMTYKMTKYYEIRYVPQIGEEVVIKNDANLYSGSRIVGKVMRGERYVTVKIDGDWVSLKKPDGTAVSGWLKLEHLEVPAL